MRPPSSLSKAVPAAQSHEQAYGAAGKECVRGGLRDWDPRVRHKAAGSIEGIDEQEALRMGKIVRASRRALVVENVTGLVENRPKKR